MDRQYAFREGMTVFGADGDKVGKVVAVDPSYIVVEKGFFFPTDYYIPASAIANMDNDDIYLTVSKDEALNQGWDQPLAATTGYAEAQGGPVDEVIAAGYTAAADPTTASGGERLRVPVHEEELTATTRQRDLGSVRIQKNVVTEERTIDVPVTEERVRVRQVSVDRDAPTDDATAFQEGVIEVPVRGEEVDLQKRTRVTGAVEVDTEAVQRTQRVGGTVRREEVRIDDQTVQGIGPDDGEAPATPR